MPEVAIVSAESKPSSEPGLDQPRAVADHRLPGSETSRPHKKPAKREEWRLEEKRRPHSELRDFIERSDPTSIGMWVTEFDMLVRAIDYEASLRVDLEEQLEAAHTTLKMWIEAVEGSDSMVIQPSYEPLMAALHETDAVLGSSPAKRPT